MIKERIKQLGSGLSTYLKKVWSIILRRISWVYSTKDKKQKVISEAEYYKAFGLVRNSKGVLKLIDENKENQSAKEKVAEAYKRAWENRDFEIDKFWSRAAYFWAFLVLIFGAYFRIVEKIMELECTKEAGINEQELGNVEIYHFIETSLLCMGLVFSVAWTLVILGSKHWQENWEMQIDKLENFVSGPLYKTIYYKRTFYSVSKINLILSIFVIVIWCLLFGFHILYGLGEGEIHGLSITLFVFTGISLMSLLFGYARKRFDVKKDEFVRRV